MNKIRYAIALFTLGFALRSVNADTRVVVTPETLTTARATGSAAAPGLNIQQGADGAFAISKDNDAAADEAIRLVRSTFDVPVCVEWGVSGNMPRFGFSIQSNQRLVDVLESMKTQSKGAVGWRLLAGRIIFTIQKDDASSAPNPMDRTLDIDMTATTLDDAMRQIEQAYNKAYLDFPLIVDVLCPDLDPQSPIAADIATAPLHVKGALPLREIIAALLARTANPSITYDVTGLTDPKNRLYFSITIGIAGCRDAFASEDEYNHVRERLTAKIARRDQYLEKAQNAAANPIAPSAARKQK